MLLKTESTRAAVYRAAWCSDTEDPDTALACASAKVYADDAGRLGCGEACRCTAALASRGSNLHCDFKRAKTLELHYGSTEAQLEKALIAAGY